MAIAATAFAALAAGASAACPQTGCGGGGDPVVTHQVTVTVSGQGTVSDGTTPGTCTRAQSPCTFTYADGDSASIQATAAGGSFFERWGGDAGCAANPCSLVINGPVSLSATFAPDAPAISSPTAAVHTSTTGGAVAIAFSTPHNAECRIDLGPWAACASGASTGSLTTGDHAVHVRAKDSDLNVSPPTTRGFRIVNLPDTVIGGAPAAASTTSQNSTNFAFGALFAHPSGNPAPEFECDLDGVIVPCSANLGPLADGTHTLTVSARIKPFADQPFYADPQPATRTWTVDTTGPTVSITSGPADGSSTTATTADFAFTSSEGTTECSLDGAAFGPCPAAGQASYTGLGVGQHTFRVRGVDALGNAGAPASRSWTIVAPAAGPQQGAGPDGGQAGSDAGQAGSGGAGGSAAQKIKATLAARWLTTRRGTRVRKLVLTALPAGAKAQVSCKSKAKRCPFTKKSVTAKGGKADLLKLFRKRLLGKGDVIEIRITKPGMTAQVLRFTMRPPKQPKRSG